MNPADSLIHRPTRSGLTLAILLGGSSILESYWGLFFFNELTHPIGRGVYGEIIGDISAMHGSFALVYIMICVNLMGPWLTRFPRWPAPLSLELTLSV